jgi:hypothetical protein
MSAGLSPTEVLSAEVVDRLLEAGLLRAEKRDDLIKKIASGSMRGDDWKLEIELAQAKVLAK